MSVTRRSLELPASPPSVKMARAWVSEVLRELGRPELVASAQLGVSELVTNALLHADPPLTVRVAGTIEHPRVEVSDTSATPVHRLRLPAIEDDDLPATFGRGLDLVAMNAIQWGSDHYPDGTGKTVWFEPADQMRDDIDMLDLLEAVEVYDLSEAMRPPDDSVTVTLTHMPAQLFGQLRHYHFELRREMRLLALSDPEKYPLAVAVTELFLRSDEDRRSTLGVAALDAAIAQGLPSVDLVYEVPAGAPAMMARARDLLAETDDLFAEDLLTLAPPPQLRELQQWYFTEFERQGAGLPPTPWSGALTLQTSL